MNELRNVTTGAVLAGRVQHADSLWQRTIGLIGREQISSDEGLWIDQCSGVHTFGMRAYIDIIFVDREGHVLKILRNVKPNEPQISCALAFAVVETGVAAERGHDLLVGDQLVLQPPTPA